MSGHLEPTSVGSDPGLIWRSADALYTIWECRQPPTRTRTWRNPSALSSASLPKFEPENPTPRSMLCPISEGWSPWCQWPSENSRFTSGYFQENCLSPFPWALPHPKPSTTPTATSGTTSISSSSGNLFWKSFQILPKSNSPAYYQNLLKHMLRSVLYLTTASFLAFPSVAVWLELQASFNGRLTGRPAGQPNCWPEG